MSFVIVNIPTRTPKPPGISKGILKVETALVKVVYSPIIKSTKEPLTPGRIIVAAAMNPARNRDIKDFTLKLVIAIVLTSTSLNIDIITINVKVKRNQR